MKFLAYNLAGERLQNLEGTAAHHFVAGGLDTLTVTTAENNVRKNYRLMYQNKQTGRWYEFIVASVDETHDASGVTYEIYAENSLIDLKSYDPILDRRGDGKGMQEALEWITLETDWRFESDIPGNAGWNFYRISRWDALSEVLKAFGAEFETKITVEGNTIHRTLRVTSKVGRDNGKRFSYRKDMTKVTRTVNEDDIVTRLYPFGKGDEVGDGYGRRIDISEVNDGKLYVEDVAAQRAYGYRGRPFSAVKNYEEITDKTALKAEALRDLEELAKPSVTYEASVVDLKSYGFDYEGVEIGDTIRIRDKELDLALVGRVAEMEVDPDGMNETTLKLGSLRPSTASEFDSIAKTLERVTAKEGALDTLANHEAFIDMVIKGLNESFQNANSYAEFDPLTGLTFTNTPDPKTATWALNIGSAGFRIASSKRSNGEWNWRTFGTGEGFTADLIRAGRIQGKNFELNLETGSVNFGDQILFDGTAGTLTLGPGTVGNEQLAPEVDDKITGQINAETKGKADKAYLLKQINASAETIRIDGGKVEVTGDTYIERGRIGNAEIGELSASKITSGYLSADRILGGTIDAQTINVDNLNASNLTRGAVENVPVSLGSASLPTYGSANLYGSGTDLKTGSSAFVFDYGTNTFEVAGRIAGNVSGGTRNSLEMNGLSISANGSMVELKPWGGYIKLSGYGDPIRMDSGATVLGTFNFETAKGGTVNADKLVVKNLETGKTYDVAYWFNVLREKVGI